ncbi:unnamed protein product [Gongylonema pulchrum]|uniref:Vps16_N domain-containing protein n=1 Tax=Gongylonema pulchrum TaxID=637853 RepID=A0A183DXH0_9BILA|nr:unnamed protein product [Gongylonema pulchrum]
MRNLKISSAVVLETWLGASERQEQQSLPKINEIEAMCVDSEKRIFCACIAGVYEVSASSPELIDWTQQRGDAALVAFDYLSDDYRLCAVFSSGIVTFIDPANKIVRFLRRFRLPKNCYFWQAG